jgi:hypothetical protein
MAQKRKLPAKKVARIEQDIRQEASIWRKIQEIHRSDGNLAAKLRKYVSLVHKRK